MALELEMVLTQPLPSLRTLFRRLLYGAFRVTLTTALDLSGTYLAVETRNAPKCFWLVYAYHLYRPYEVAASE